MQRLFIWWKINALMENVHFGAIYIFYEWSSIELKMWLVDKSDKYQVREGVQKNYFFSSILLLKYGPKI